VGLPVPDELKKAGLGEHTEPFNRVLQEVAWETVMREPLSGVKPPRSPAGLEPALGKTGRLLLEERFDGETLPNGWSVKSGRLRVAAGALHAGRKADDGRLSLFSREQPLQDAAIQIDFKFNGTRGINLGVNPSPGELKKKGHLFSLMITPRGWNITEHNDKADRTSRSKVLASAPAKFEQVQWYTLLLECKGGDVVARVAGKEPLRVSSEEFRVKKPGLEFRVAGPDGEEVSFDNLQVWELK